MAKTKWGAIREPCWVPSENCPLVDGCLHNVVGSDVVVPGHGHSSSLHGYPENSKPLCDYIILSRALTLEIKRTTGLLTQ